MPATPRSDTVRAAVSSAFAAFAPHHPAFVGSLFDERLLQARVAPLLDTPEGVSQITPAWLAGAWAAQFGENVTNERLVALALPVAADFIRHLIRALAPPAGSLLALEAGPAAPRTDRRAA